MPQRRQRGPDFMSLVDGGPFHRLLVAVGAKGAAGDAGIARACVVACSIVWLPLLVATAIQGREDASLERFVRDVGAHARLLVALPIFLAVEGRIGRRLGDAVRYLVVAGLVGAEERSAFDAAVKSALRLRDSWRAEPVMAVAVLAVSVSDAMGVEAMAPGWRVSRDGGAPHLSAAGAWYLFVSFALFRFLLLRWLWRLLIWSRFVWALARVPLRYVPTHPDGSAGLSPFASAHVAFGWVHFALAVTLAGHFTTRVLTEGRSVQDFQTELLTYALLGPLLFLAPLLSFAPSLERARRHALHRYAVAGAEHGRAYFRRFLRQAGSEPFPRGEPDVQTHADMGASFHQSVSRPLWPFTRWQYLLLFGVGVVPIVAYLAREMPLLEIAKRLIGALG